MITALAFLKTAVMVSRLQRDKHIQVSSMGARKLKCRETLKATQALRKTGVNLELIAARTTMSRVAAAQVGRHRDDQGEAIGQATRSNLPAKCSQVIRRREAFPA